MTSIFAILAAAALAAPQPMPDRAKPVCQTMAPIPAGQQRVVHAQTLNALPNANLMRSVLRTVDGCSRPAIVRYDIGGAPRR